MGPRSIATRGWSALAAHGRAVPSASFPTHAPAQCLSLGRTAAPAHLCTTPALLPNTRASAVSPLLSRPTAARARMRLPASNAARDPRRVLPAARARPPTHTLHRAPRNTIPQRRRHAPRIAHHTPRTAHRAPRTTHRAPHTVFRGLTGVAGMWAGGRWFRRLTLLYATVLFLAREPFRKACLSIPKEDITPQVR